MRDLIEQIEPILTRRSLGYRRHKTNGRPCVHYVLQQGNQARQKRLCLIYVDDALNYFHVDTQNSTSIHPWDRKGFRRQRAKSEERRAKSKAATASSSLFALSALPFASSTRSPALRTLPAAAQVLLRGAS